MKSILSIVTVYCLSIFLLIRYQSDVIHLGSNQSEKESGIEPDKKEGPMEFFRFHQGIRTKEGESSVGYESNYQWKELNKALKNASFAARTESANGVLEYKERGPANVPGRTRGVIVDPDDAGHKTWFVGSVAGGIWKTIDGGQSWQWLTPNIPNMATTVLAMAPTNHNTIYAGTGEGFGLLDGVSGNGIFKSTDRGINWTLLNNTVDFDDINRIIISPTDENLIIAVTNAGIYRSQDGAFSWAKVFSGVVQDIKATPGNFSIQYATQYAVGVIKSIDGGATWAPSKSGMSPSGRLEIAVSPINPDRIFASAQGALSGVKSDLYFSNDAAQTWTIVDLTLSNKTLNYLGDQGWYDNTIACDPYNQNVVYVGGIGVFKAEVSNTATGTPTGSYSMEENGTNFLTLVNFGATAYGGKLAVSGSANKTNVEIRFGSGKSQKAHRFLVPDGSTSGVPDANYSYQDYVNVPFEVWDITNNKQLMVSFRDQDRNGEFNLLLQNTADAPAQQSREYLFIHNIDYNAVNPSPTVTVAGGQTITQMYNLWPVLSTGFTWSPNSLPTSSLKIIYTEVSKISSTVTTLSDSYSDYDGVNNANFVHPDQHNIVIIKENDASKTFRILLANDGGLFLSSVSTSPGTTQGEWIKSGKGYNTSQFYGADKRPGFEEFIGGMQDNATYFSPAGTIASSTTSYTTNFALGGDGFECLWHSIDDKKIIGGSQYCNFARTINGTTWSKATTGLTLSGSNPDPAKFPFVSKLAHSKQAPDIIFTVGSEGVWRSTDFGANWALTPITQKWGLTSFIDVEVSRANANIVWAGSGMSGSRSLFVSSDGGKSFTATQNYITSLGSITKLASHPIEPSTAYALFSFAKTPKILRTKDLGQTWEDLSGFANSTVSTNGFPDVAVYCLYVRTDNPDIIWAGTEIGIVESLDGGLTWNILSEFPKVPVWDMKGQDDLIVIATHGRGIWTAKVPAAQIVIKNPLLLAAGTTPQSDFALKLMLNEDFDSTQVWINSQKIGKIAKVAQGTYVAKITGAPKGTLDVKLIGYLNGSPLHSSILTTENITLKSTQTQYFNLFSSDSDFSLKDLSVGAFSAIDQALQSLHSYQINSESMALLKQPIVVSASNATFFYRDVAIVEPGASGSVFGQPNFNDYVVVEATKDGVTWVPLENGYNASFNPKWLSAYSGNSDGNETLFLEHSLNLQSKFAAKDTLLFRFRLHSNQANTGWGWAIDDLFIQQPPTGIAKSQEKNLQLFPNPTNGKIQMTFSLQQPSEVFMQIIGLDGKLYSHSSLGVIAAGSHQQEVNLDSLSDGAYLIRLLSEQGSQQQKVIVRK